jgi:YD repeat-containing protein
VVHPTGATADTGGQAGFAYDLAGRLVSYTSPYKAAPADTARPTTTYSLDDGANITAAATVVAGQTRRAESSTYPNGQLATRSTSTPPSGPSATADTAIGYSTLGEETSRTTTTTTTAPLPPSTAPTPHDHHDLAVVGLIG